MSWLDRIIEATEEFETPQSYIWWSALCAISAVVNRNVYLDRFNPELNLYPNLYVLLVGPPGIKKGAAIGMAKKLVSKVGNTKVIGGSSTIQAIIAKLGKTETKEGQKGPKLGADAFIAASEFKVIIAEDPMALPTLIDLYDTHAHEEWVKDTKNAGTDTLKNVCITLLGASNQSLLEEAMPASSAEGGFISRCVLILENKNEKVNDLTEPPEFPVNYEELTKHLKDLSTVKGTFSYTPEGKEYYRDWYRGELKPMIEQTEDKFGALARFDVQVLKTSMLISLAEGASLKIDRHHLALAIEKCSQHLDSVHRIMGGQGKSESAHGIKVVIETLLKQPRMTMTRSTLLQKKWGDFNCYELDKVVETLYQKKALDITVNGRDTKYTLSPSFAEIYQKFRAQREGEAKAKLPGESEDSSG